MSKVKFVTVSELNSKATAIVSHISQNENEVVVTKKGKPVVVLRKVTGPVSGESETVSYLKNNTMAFVSAVEKSDRDVIITKNRKAVVVVQKISSDILIIENRKKRNIESYFGEREWAKIRKSRNKNSSASDLFAVGCFLFGGNYRTAARKAISTALGDLGITDNLAQKISKAVEEYWNQQEFYNMFWAHAEMNSLLN